MTTASVCRAVATAIAVPALLLGAPAMAMAAGDTHGTAAHQTVRGGSPCGTDYYACVHWHAAYHWHGEYHVLGTHVEGGDYWNAGAYAVWSPDHDAHGHYWNAGSHVNVSHYYGD